MFFIIVVFSLTIYALSMIILGSIYDDKCVTANIISIICIFTPIINTIVVIYALIHNRKKCIKKYSIKQFLSELKDE